MSRIDIRKVSVVRGGTPVVHRATFGVAASTWFGVIGANGSGKTSLLRAIAGRLDIAEGECAIAGTELSTDRFRRAQCIGFMPTIESLPTVLTGRQILRLAAPRGSDGLHSLGPINAALHIGALLDQPVAHFSSGMRQRLAIACAFASGASAIILDEPFNWLDPVAAFDTRTALAAMVAAGLTLVTALHDMSVFARCCHAGIVMSDGAVALSLSDSDLRHGQQDPAAFEDRLIAALR
ncbi:MAG: ABC transporter ATP-binding protein [Sphingomonas sp.]|uniref:ATP-binding cassette domain-containing protein n=1 Tax=Sphingomonas sp. TaxID=28214 RepID=UPI001ACC90D2|nr:ABC transporter ATP-binding protein [Sphingomonas sp.]MBN8808400.1 ABC transporter ATP-binding protein [Sphingomonas sp.]